MVYVSVSYNYSPDFDSPESWFKRTRGYIGTLECLAEHHTVINVKQINYAGEIVHNGVHHCFVDFGKKATFFPWKLNAYIKHLNPDVIIFQGLHHPIQLILLKSILKKSTRLIAHHHGEKPYAGFKKYVQKLADQFVDAYLFASMEMGMDWVAKNNISTAQKLHEIMEVSSVFYPIDQQQAKPVTNTRGKPIFLWVGRLNQNKDPLCAVKAFLRYAEVNPQARLYMFYHTEELLPQITTLLEHHPCKLSIILMGKHENDALLYWYNSADFFISASHYEAAGTAVCEAMSCGCIPILTNIPSFKMMTDDGKNGILYEAGDEQGLFNALLKLNEIDREQYKHQTLKFFKSNLSFQAIANRIIQITDGL